MKINKIGLNSTNFKSNYFTIEKNGKYYDLNAISTDNEEKLGKEPVLEYVYIGEKHRFPMIYDGKYYTSSVLKGITKYRILYKDTGKYEKNGEEQIINPLELSKKATIADRKYDNLPLEQAISKGKASGKVYVNTHNISENEPVILILDYINKEEDIITNIPDNVHGLIVSSSDMGILSHIGNLARNHIYSMSIVWDGDKYDNLKKLEGKYISINNESGILEYKETTPANIKGKEAIQKVKVPKLENVERLLNFDELTPQNCGSKGYRIGVMQRLAKEGKLKDITVPNGFVIPEGYLNKFREYIKTDDFEEEKRRILEGFYTQDTDKKVEELGLPRQNLIIRSNFNTEDMGSFSSAGIYLSEMANKYGSIILNANEVANYSFNEDLNPVAKIIHKKHGIEDKDIQPSVIVQECINPDYTFTVYSDDGDNNIIIDMSDDALGYLKPVSALVKYNKKTTELTLDRKQFPFAEYVIDEKGNVINQKHPKGRIEENWNILAPLLGIVTSGALVLEKFFNHPQDIEGGIGKDGKVYFWQTRDIVAKAVKRI